MSSRVTTCEESRSGNKRAFIELGLCYSMGLCERKQRKSNTFVKINHINECHRKRNHAVLVIILSLIERSFTLPLTSNHEEEAIFSNRLSNLILKDLFFSREMKKNKLKY